jgi:hypothetical protein
MTELNNKARAEIIAILEQAEAPPPQEQSVFVEMREVREREEDMPVWQCIAICIVLCIVIGCVLFVFSRLAK